MAPAEAVRRDAGWFFDNLAPDQTAMNFFSKNYWIITVKSIVSISFLSHAPVGHFGTPEVERRILIHKIDLDLVRDDAGFVAFAEESFDGFAPSLSVVESEVVDPHGDEAVGEFGLHVAG